MFADSSSPFAIKRRRFTNVDQMDAEGAKAKLAAVTERVGREIRVFDTFASSSSPSTVSISEESDEFYELTAGDYYRLMSTKKEDKYLKTQKIREAEQAARRSKYTKTVIRVRFPANCTLEATFHPSETIQSLIDLLKKVVAQPDLPFYIYTTPPKKLLKDMAQDFFSAGFVPGAIVYFSYDLPKGENSAAPVSFLQEEIMALKDLEFTIEPTASVHTEPEHVATEPPSVPTVPEPKPAGKKFVKPKWLKM